MFVQVGRFKFRPMGQEERQRMMTPVELGFWTTVVLEAAEKSLKLGRRSDKGTVEGVSVNIAELMEATLGAAARQYR